MNRYIGVFWLLVALGSGAVAASSDDLEQSFNPYRSGYPKFPGLVAGTVIRKNNVEQFKEAIDPGLYLTIKNGWQEVKVMPTTALPVDPAKLEATRKSMGKTSLGPRSGDIEAYGAGRPFIEEPDIKDPRAGEKLALNFKYSAGVGENATIFPFYWRYRDMRTGNVERTVNFSFHFLKYKHRTRDPAPEITPNPANLFLGIYARVLAPLDLKDTQLLIHRYDDDHRIDDAYMYFGFQRRVRRLATGQTTDAFLGSDVMIEDFEGYNAQISDMKWAYRGSQILLLPIFNHNELSLASDMPTEADGYRFVNFSGYGGCFPDVTWQLRKVFVLEAVPLAAGHPVSKRIFYLDAQSMQISRALIYDRRGELWKIGTLGKTHPDFHLPENKGTGTPIDDAFSAVDVQAMHCTTGQFKSRVDATVNRPSLFQVQNMRGD
ncbi:conserved exported protein of unknown function [Georgfuchsia toluolica]|uniref:DUF1329 domain-containing protein n=1 Tax=Georgfuchsia toluolica TaxID=424218 RepID=A0A916J8M7_9PROT|nr:DUF1329 domain-containing protein [Georgfuchsia toluolica]CAG4884391.1 conserved exported protein of unknown function [Georgfuchsia toluolica]